MKTEANIPRKRPLLLWIGLGLLLLILAGLMVTAALLALYLVPVGSERSQVSGPEPALVSAATPAEFAERNGIEVVMLGVTAEGGLIDMRFRVIDAEKAAFIMEEVNRPRLIAEHSGIVLTQHVRPEYRTLEEGRVYYLLYTNAQYAIRPGSMVTVELAGLRLEHLVAQ